MARIVALGDLVLDVVVAGEIGGTRDAQGAVKLFPGGSAANFAVAAARLGAEVTFFGRVGDDVAGRLVVAELAREGVTTRVRGAPGAATGSVLVQVGADGATRMISDPGASALFAVEDLDGEVLRGAELVHLTGYSWLRGGSAAEAAREGGRMAREGKGLLSLDPGPAHLIAAYGGARFVEEIGAAGVDLLFPNLEEGMAMTGEREPREIVRALRGKVRVVALKMGGKGCLVGAGESVEWVAAERVEVVDATGAGDAFAAGFGVAYLGGSGAVEAARAGAGVAGGVVARMGGR